MPESLPAKRDITFGHRGLELRSLDDAYRFAQYAIKSGMAPSSIDTPEKALIAIQYGAELGFNAMRALTAINVINGVPSLKGEAALALIRQSGACVAGPIIGNDGEGDEHCGFVRFQRMGLEPVEIRFTVAEAKRAGLWERKTRDGKPAPWSLYPDDLLIWRAVARATKRYFSDVLLGLVIAEEAQDYGAREIELEAVQRAPILVPSLPEVTAESESSAEFPPEAADTSAPTGAGEEGGESSTESDASGPAAPAGGHLEPPPLPLPGPDPGDPLGDQGMLDLQRKEFAAAVRQRCVQAKRPEKSAELLLKLLQKNGFAASKDVPSESWPRLILQARQAVVPT